MGSPSAFKIRHAARHLRLGGLLAYPTEAVFGIGCNPLDLAAFERLLKLKGRVASKGVILIAEGAECFQPWIEGLPADAWDRMRGSWPGPVTWVAPAAKWVPDWIGGGRGTIAVRVPGHALARRLCAALSGPLVSTSANPSGRPPARTALGVRRYFGDERLVVLAGSVGSARRPSSVRDARTGQLLRA